jgi:Tol biopolymer transport system component
MKKIFIVSAVLLFVVLVFLGIYNFAFRTDTPTVATEVEDQITTATTTSSEAVSTSTIQDVPQDKIIPVTMAKVLSPVIDKENNRIKFYDQATGHVLGTIITGGTEKVISDVDLKDLVYVAWAPNTEQVLTKFSSSGNIRVYSYDHRTSSGTQLKSGIERVDWTTLGDQIVYIYHDKKTNQYSLDIALPDGSGYRTLVRNIDKYTYFDNVPQSSRIAFWPAPNAHTKTQLRVISLADKNARPKTIFTGQYNADFLFSPDGNHILVSSTQERGSNKRMLGVMNSNGGEYRNLQIPTNVSKCVWSHNSQYVYCALPTGDRDTFWKINIATREQERIIDLDNISASSTTYNAFDLLLTPDGDAIFFVNRIDGHLYRITL